MTLLILLLVTFVVIKLLGVLGFTVKPKNGGWFTWQSIVYFNYVFIWFLQVSDHFIEVSHQHWYDHFLLTQRCFSHTSGARSSFGACASDRWLWEIEKTSEKVKKSLEMRQLARDFKDYRDHFTRTRRCWRLLLFWVLEQWWSTVVHRHEMILFKLHAGELICFLRDATLP